MRVFLVCRPSKKQKSTNAAEIRRLHEPLEKIHPKIRVTASQPGSSQSFKLSQGKPLANRSGTTYKGALKHGESNTLSIHGDLKDQTGFSSAQWKELAAETYKQEPRAVQVKNIVAAETLLERFPGATVAGFGPKNSVGIHSFGFDICWTCQLGSEHGLKYINMFKAGDWLLRSSREDYEKTKEARYSQEQSCKC